MKTKTKLSLILSSIALGLGAFSALSAANAFEVKGYNSTSLTSDIDLNDASENTIRNYYSALNSLGEKELKGTNLLKNLKPILKNGQKYYSYDSGKKNIWKMYEIIDRDWVKSPASSIPGYNSASNKINGYSYLDTVSSQNPGPYVHALYVNRDDENLTTAWGDHNQSQWGINQEHIWAKSNGFESKGNGGARGDPMHLWAGNGKVNGAFHSNYFYAYVDNNRSFSDAGNTYSNLEGNLKGFSKTLGSGDTNNVFEPQDSDKGDIARAIFYMVARYNYLSGSDSDGIDSNNPNLTLVQNSNYTDAGYESSTTRAGTMGVLTDLLAWHHADPVDTFEIHRNNLLYTNYTNNRNPFIDFPEWVDYIWGTTTYSGNTYVSYNSTPTGYANPNEDTINGYNSGLDESLTLSQTSASLLVGDSENLTATPLPSGTVTWETSNSSVVTISKTSGTTTKITGVSAGTAKITATATINEHIYTKVCNVTVTSEDTPSVGPEFTISKGTYTPGYASGGTSGTIYESIVSDNDLEINYSGINTKSGPSASAYGYTMYLENKGFIYSNNCPNGYYPTKVTVTFSNGTSVAGKVGISFNNTVLSTRDSTVTGAVSKGGSITLTNDNPDNLYWNISTTGANVQFATIQVKYEQIPIQVSNVTLNSHNETIEIDEELQLSATVLPANADDPTLTWESSDENVASVSDDGLVTGISEGIAEIRAISINEIYDTCFITVTNPEAEDLDLAYRFTTKGWGALSGSTMEGASTSANWESNIDGYQFSNGRGIQVTKNYSGANATSTNSYSKVAKIALYYSTNASSGEGSADIKVGNTSLTPDGGITKTGGTTLRSLDFNATTPLNGKITITITCSTNSIYVYGCVITLADNPEPYHPTNTYDIYEKVTSSSDLRTGDKILLVGTMDSENYYAMGAQATYVRSAVKVTLENGNTTTNISEVSGYQVVTLGGTNNAWTLNVEGGYLYPADDNYHDLKTTDVLNDDSRWTITIENGLANIVCNGSYNYDQINYFETGSNPKNRFSCDNHSSAQKNVVIFKSYEYEADLFGKDFLNNYTAGCKDEGYTESKMHWGFAELAFNDLTTRTKEILKATEIDTDLSASYRAQAMARYDQIIRKYGTSTFANFIDRVISNSITNPRLNSNSANQLIIILVVGSITIISVASFFIIRRRKEE